MLKVLIAEDEYLVRQMLKLAIPWEECGFYIAAEADTGKQVLEIIEQIKPDLLLLDINMPMINGMEIARIVSAQDPDIMIVIVTGYDVFEYARQAIVYGVCDYLLKPVRNEELMNTVLKCKQRAYDRKAAPGSKSDAKEIFLRQWLSVQMGEHILKQKLEEHDVTLKPNMLCFAAQIDDSRRVTSEQGGEHALRKYVCEIQQIFEYNSKTMSLDSVFVPLRVNLAAGVLSADADIEAIAPLYFAEVMKHVWNNCNLTLTIGVSSAGDQLQDMPKMHAMSLEMLERKFFAGNNRVISHADLPQERTETAGYSDFHQEKLSFLIRTGNRTEIEKMVKDYIAALRKIPHLKENQARWQCMGLIDYESYKMCEWDIDQGQMHQLETIDELENWLVHALTRLSHREHKDKSHSMVDATVKYVSEHYGDPQLSVDTISQTLYISASYLSRLFKKYYAVGLNEFINDMRMRKAVELLKTSEGIKMNDVSQMVGYRDPHYFSKCFKKQFGISFSEWKRVQ